MTDTPSDDPLRLDWILDGSSRAHVVTLRLKRLLHEDLRRVLAEHTTLSIPEWRILSILNQSDGPQPQKDIVNGIKIAQAQASRALFEMQKRGLLEGTQSSADRRAWNYTLSDEGRALFAQTIPYMKARQDTLDGAVSAEELQVFESVASRIAMTAQTRAMEGKTPARGSSKRGK